MRVRSERAARLRVVVKTALLRLLARTPLLRPAYRVYEAALALRTPRRRTAPPDALPLPPRRLIVRVAGTPDADWFLESGRAAAETVHAALAQHGVRLADVGVLLDFGCGAGRVVRHWRRLPAEVVGTDHDAETIEWCRRNLPFARFVAHGLEPPLPLASGSVDVAYALSVLTHLPERLGLAWMKELRGALRPGGHLLLTTHGRRYLGELAPGERRRFGAGELVVRRAELPGTNLCTAFHPEKYVRTRLARGFDVVELVAEGASGNPHQDLWLLRKP